MTESYEFSVDLSPFKRIEGKQHLQKLLREQLMKSELNINYRIVLKPASMYAYCTRWRSKLNYQKTELENFILTKFNSMHYHKPMNLSNTISDFITSLPSSLSTNSKKKIVLKAFNIKASSFYYYHKKATNYSQTYSQVLQELNQLEFYTNYQPFPLESEKDIPTVLLTISPQMYEAFQKYGQFCSFDLTYNLVKHQTRYALGVVCGLNHNYQIIPFAIILTNQQTEEAFYNIFQAFFSIMKKLPEVIVSDEQLTVKLALRRLNEQGLWNGVHLFDSFHMLRNLRKKTKNQVLLRELRNAIFADQQKGFDEAIKKAQESAISREDVLLLEKFVASSFSLCFSKVRGFCGHSISTTYNQKMNDIIKAAIQYEKPFPFVLREVVGLMQKLLEKNELDIKYCKLEYQNLFDDHQIRIVRYSVHSKVFFIFLKNYAKSLALKANEVEGQWNFWDQNCYVLFMHKKLLCSCKYSERCGIPCEHLLFCAKQIRQAYLTYFHHRWLQDSSSKEKKKINEGRPRLSRRCR